MEMLQMTFNLAFPARKIVSAGCWSLLREGFTWKRSDPQLCTLCNLSLSNCLAHNIWQTLIKCMLNACSRTCLGKMDNDRYTGHAHWAALNRSCLTKRTNTGYTVRALTKLIVFECKDRKPRHLVWTTPSKHPSGPWPRPGSRPRLGTRPGTRTRPKIPKNTRASLCLLLVLVLIHPVV